MWMINEREVFNTETGLTFYVKILENSCGLCFGRVGSSSHDHIAHGTLQEVNAVFDNIITKLNPVNVGILHRGETEGIERELRDIVER